MLTHDELQAIKERAEKATAGPWIKYDEHGRWICNYPMWDYIGEIKEEADYNFIANVRDDVPKLIAEIDSLNKRREISSEQISQLFGTVARLENALNTIEKVTDCPVIRELAKDSLTGCDNE